jgi:PTH1 family peptidyl-tRNA hydrolase
LSGIALIVGLGNPGEKYAKTRHNVGAWLITQLAEQANQPLRRETKLKSHVATLTLADQPCKIAIPTTYMNESGAAVLALAQFYKLAPEQILVAHDDLDFPAGTVRLKQGGGAGGHNGLKDIMACLPNPNFWRLRIGIGHPGNRNDVLDYVLHSPAKADREAILTALTQSIDVLPLLVAGKPQAAMQTLHSPPL